MQPGDERRGWSFRLCYLFTHKPSFMLSRLPSVTYWMSILYFTHFYCSLSTTQDVNGWCHEYNPQSQPRQDFFFFYWSGTGPYFSQVVTPDVWLGALVLVSPVLRVLWLVDCTVGYGGAVHCLLLRVLCKTHTQATCMSSSTEAAPSMMTTKGLVCRKKKKDLYIKRKINQILVYLCIWVKFFPVCELSSCWAPKEPHGSK